MTTHAPLRSRRTKAESVYHVQVLGDGDSPTSPLKDTRLEASAAGVVRQAGTGYELASSHAISSVSKRSGDSACGLWLASCNRTYLTWWRPAISFPHTVYGMAKSRRPSTSRLGTRTCSSDRRTSVRDGTKAKSRSNAGPSQVLQGLEPHRTLDWPSTAVRARDRSPRSSAWQAQRQGGHPNL